MEKTELQTASQSIEEQSEMISSLVLSGDLSKMTPEQKVLYYNSFCKALQLNPLTQPFEITILKGKERMYATKACTEQLRRLNGISITDLQISQTNALYTVIAKGVDKTGRVDAATAVLTIQGLSGENLANAMMKCETKAKRRLTLSMCGLGILDETEVESIHTAMVETKQQATNTSPQAATPDAPMQEAMATDEDYKSIFDMLVDPVLANVGLFNGEEKLTTDMMHRGVWKKITANGGEGIEKSKADEYITYLKKQIEYFTANPVAPPQAEEGAPSA